MKSAIIFLTKKLTARTYMDRRIITNRRTSTDTLYNGPERRAVCERRKGLERRRYRKASAQTSISASFSETISASISAREYSLSNK